MERDDVWSGRRTKKPKKQACERGRKREQGSGNKFLKGGHGVRDEDRLLSMCKEGK